MTVLRWLLRMMAIVGVLLAGLGTTTENATAASRPIFTYDASAIPLVGVHAAGTAEASFSVPRLSQEGRTSTPTEGRGTSTTKVLPQTQLSCLPTYLSMI